MLVRRYQRLIYAIPQRAGLDADAAGEVFQEVFMTLMQKLDGIEQPERLHAWLVTTARRKTWRAVVQQRMGRGRSVGGGEEADTEDEMLAVPDNAPLPDEMLANLEEQHRIRTAIAGLDERCQKLLTMLYYEAEPPSYAAIAAQLGTSEGSIGPTRARCLKKLLKLFDQ